VSPLWRDQIRIVLCPQQVILLRLKCGWRPRVGAKAVISCDSPPGEPVWQAASNVLAMAVEKPEWRNADAVAVLSNHFVRYMLTPWSDELSNDREQIEFARHGFARIFGQAVEQWEVRLGLDEAGAPYVACAVDRALIERLQEITENNRLRLISIQPYLMAAFNHWHARFQEGSQWFVLAERGRLCLALLQDNHWRWLRCQRIDEATRAELPILLEREEYMAGVPETVRTVLLHAPEWADVPPIDGRTIQRLALPLPPGFSPVTDMPFSMAVKGYG
jgi:hypothetical protein